ncbi:hypothetical protein CCYA_CCYA18G4584 [Cyanidiococcus yangmingshanensis]|nr:hypothetical protein CCYA_CCYA18G4584 [Cyanidiococcus yangmingshanensis]
MSEQDDLAADSFHETVKRLLGVADARLEGCLYRAATESAGVRAFLDRLEADLGRELASTIDDALGWRLWEAAQRLRERTRQTSQVPGVTASVLDSVVIKSPKRPRRSRWQVETPVTDALDGSEQRLSGVDWTLVAQLRLQGPTTFASLDPALDNTVVGPRLQDTTSTASKYAQPAEMDREPCIDLFWETANLGAGEPSLAMFALAPFLKQPLQTEHDGDGVGGFNSNRRPMIGNVFKAKVPKLWRATGELSRSARNGSDLLLQWLRRDLAQTGCVVPNRRTLDEQATTAIVTTAAMPSSTLASNASPAPRLENGGAGATTGADRGFCLATEAQAGNGNLHMEPEPSAGFHTPAQPENEQELHASQQGTKAIVRRQHRRSVSPAYARCGSVSESTTVSSSLSIGDREDARLRGQRHADWSSSATETVPGDQSLAIRYPLVAGHDCAPDAAPRQDMLKEATPRFSTMISSWASDSMRPPDALCLPSSACRPQDHAENVIAFRSSEDGHPPPALPIARCEEMLIDLVARFPVVIVVGETGSGKSTQIPQYLWRAGWARQRHQEASTTEMTYAASGKWIGCTQPRRVATTRLAKRVASEMGCNVGGLVGYSIRFEDRTSAATEIKYMTDGVLLREAASDPRLSCYSILMIDEAHERSLNTDLLLAILKRRFDNAITETRSGRPLSAAVNQRLVIASATLDAGRFTTYFQGAPILTVPGRLFPVDILWRPLPRWRSPNRAGLARGFTTDYLETTIQLALEIHQHEADGDILAFLTGQDDVEAAVAIMTERWTALERIQHPSSGGARRLVARALYANMPLSRQQQALVRPPSGTRKCIFATNVAETSLTIDGIRYVIDSGLAKQKIYLPSGLAGVERLVLAPISQAAARQRAGRAGRTSPGRCFRLYSREAWEREMLPHTVPEIARTDLSQLVLRLVHLGIIERAQDLLEGSHEPLVRFLDPPPVPALVVAMQHLWTLTALDGITGRLTAVGERLAVLPLEPRLGRFLLAGIDLGCPDEVLTIVAMLSVGAGESSAGGDVFARPKDPLERIDAERAHQQFSSSAGDVHRLLRVYMAWAASSYSSEWCDANFVHFRALLRARAIRQQLERVIRQHEWHRGDVAGTIHRPAWSTCLSLDSRVTFAFLAGFFANVAQQTWVRGQALYQMAFDGTRVRRHAESTARGRATTSMLASIHPSSCLFGTNPPLLAYAELVETQKLYLRCCVRVPSRHWLRAVAPCVFP